MSNYFRTTYFPHHDDTWTGDFHPKFYKGIPGATMDDFLTHMDSRYDDVYSYFFEGVDEDGIIDWTDKNLVEDYLDYIQYYYFITEVNAAICVSISSPMEKIKNSLEAASMDLKNQINSLVVMLETIMQSMDSRHAKTLR